MQKSNAETFNDYRILVRGNLLILCLKEHDGVLPNCWCDKCFHIRYLRYLNFLGFNQNIKSCDNIYEDDYLKYINYYVIIDPRTNTHKKLEEKERAHIKNDFGLMHYFMLNDISEEANLKKNEYENTLPKAASI